MVKTLKTYPMSFNHQMLAFKGVLSHSSIEYRSLDRNSGRCRIDDLSWKALGVNISWILHIHVSYDHPSLQIDNEEYLVTAWPDSLHGITHNVINKKKTVFNDFCDDSLNVFETSLESRNVKNNCTNELESYSTMIFDNSVCICGNGGSKVPSSAEINIKVDIHNVNLLSILVEHLLLI
jgi:hypothetical protein